MTKINVTHSLTCAAKGAGLAAACALAFAAMPASAQNSVMDPDPSVRDVALTPLSDLNLNKDEIPEILLVARSAPYSNAGLASCSDIRNAVGDLDAVLGDDYDTYIPEEHNVSATDVAQRVVGSFIPFRGIIREISGARAHEREFREAIAAGLMRRAFLKGRGLEMGCPYPASPASAALVARLQAISATPQNGDDARPEATRQSADGQTFVSRPVVQSTD